MNSSVQSESVHYKLFIEDEGVLSQTPMEIFVDLVPIKNGFQRIQKMEGPGFLSMDTLTLDNWGHPIEHVFVRKNEVTRVRYEDQKAIISSPGGDIDVPLQTDFVFDVSQIDLAMSRLDTLKDTSEVPFMLPESGNVAFLELAELRKDSIRPYFTAPHLSETTHRYGVSEGSIYEAWYLGEGRLPIKMRVTATGKTLVYYHLGENPTAIN